MDWHALDAASMDATDRYFLLTGTVLPRPVAWVTTLFADGQVNVAPYSQFMILASDPGILGIAIAPGPKARIKDTLSNVQRQGEFVINIASSQMAQEVQDSSDDPGLGVSEAKLLGLEALASTHVAPPRLLKTAVQYECTLESITAFGDGPTSLVAGRIRQVHLREGILKDGRIDLEELDPLGRLQGRKFARLGPILEC